MAAIAAGVVTALVAAAGVHQYVYDKNTEEMLKEQYRREAQYILSWQGEIDFDKYAPYLSRLEDYLKVSYLEQAGANEEMLLKLRAKGFIDESEPITREERLKKL